MISRTQVRLSIRAPIIQAFGNSADPPVLTPLFAWENQQFIPPSPPAIYVRETILFGAERLSANNTLQLVGIAQYDVFDAADNGTETAEITAQNIGGLFPAALPISNYEGMQLVVIRTDTLPGAKDREDPAWYRVPLRIEFRAFGWNSFA